MSYQSAYGSPDGSRPLDLNASRFLRSLPGHIRDQMQPDLRRVSLKREDMCFRAGEVVDFVYFPTTCLVSMVVTLENGNTIEATTVGSDGFVGLSVSLGTERADVTAMVQVAGDALRMDVNAFRSCLEEPQFRASVGRYTAKVFATIAQSTACIAFHPLQERLARWLLQVREGVEGDEFVLTQDFLAIMLGVHRPTVTIAIRMLEGAGLIEHHRGRIRIVDAAALTEAACECARLPRIALSEA